MANTMLAALGDVVDDIVVRLDTRGIRRGSDTPAVIARRRGGSAANVAAVAAHLTGRLRFLGQVGDDPTADLVLRELMDTGVDVRFVRRHGRTGTIVVLVDTSGERSFLTDPGSARALDEPDPVWLDGVDVLHVPAYSLVDGPIATTAISVIGLAHDRGIDVSIDASSSSVLEGYGCDRANELIARLRPTYLFANDEEAASLGIDGPVAGAITVVKRGGGPATVHMPGGAPVDVPAETVDDVTDTTAAGDAFAAGFLTHPDRRTDPIAATRAGHSAAADLLRSRST